MRKAVVLGAGLGLGAVLLMGSAPGVVRDVLAGLTGRGRRVGPRTQLDAAGIVQTRPAELAEASGVPLDVYSLARMTSSEAGNKGADAKVALCWATRNAAGSRGAIFAKLTGSRGPASGKYSRQNVTGGKWASTAIDPYEDDVRIAQAVLEGRVPDPTGGATNWFSPAAQDALARRGEKGYTKDAATVAAEWRARGLEPVTIAGIDRATLTFWRPA